MMARREKWFAFDVSRDLHERVKAAAQQRGQTIRDFSVVALEKAVTGDSHAIGVAVPGSHAELCEELRRFTEDAKQEIIFVGTTLRALSGDEGMEFLLDKVRKGVRLTFLLFCPQSVKDSSLRDALLRAIEQRRSADPVRTIGDIAYTVSFLKHLKSQVPRLVEGGDLIRVVGLTVCPTMGLTIVDPLVPGSKMRASLYVHQYPEAYDPALLLCYPGSEAEALMYGALYTTTTVSSTAPMR
jgi:hypothetical protein